MFSHNYVTNVIEEATSHTSRKWADLGDSSPLEGNVLLCEFLQAPSQLKTDLFPFGFKLVFLGSIRISLKSSERNF